MLSKKEFFKKITTKKIMKGREEVKTATPKYLADQIERLSPDQYLNVATNIISSRWYPSYKGYHNYNKRTAAMRKFLNHGEEVKPRRQKSLEEAMEKATVPLKLREYAFNHIQGQWYPGYSVMPLGKDQRKRKITLVQCIEGAKLYHYVQNSRANIDVKNYGTIERAKRVKKSGSTLKLKVPSRDPKEGRYKFNLFSMPTIDAPEKYAIANDIGTDHSCEFLGYKIGYKYENDKESDKVLNMCAHEIAGNFAIIEKELHENKNMVPMQMCLFAIPTQFTVDYYKKICDQVVIEYRGKRGKVMHAPLNQAEKEIALWSLVHKHKHDKTFFSKEKLANYDF